MTTRAGLVLLLLGLAACAAPPPVRSAPDRPALPAADARPRPLVAEIDSSREAGSPARPLPPPVAPRPLATAPLVAALDGRGQLALWAVVRPGELEKLAKRPIGWEAMFVQYPSEQHVPSIRRVHDLVGREPFDRARRLALALELGVRGLTVRVTDLEGSRAVTYVVTGEPRARTTLEHVEVASTTIPSVAAIGSTTIVAGPAEEAARADELLATSPLQAWDLPGERASPQAADLRVQGNGAPPATGLAGADVALVRGPDGSAHVGVVLGAPPRLLVYRWLPGRGLELRTVRAVGADLELDRVP